MPGDLEMTRFMRKSFGWDENIANHFDLKIAAIAIEKDSLLVTRNSADFARVPGLRFEDWTRA